MMVMPQPAEVVARSIDASLVPLADQKVGQSDCPSDGSVWKDERKELLSPKVALVRAITNDPCSSTEHWGLATAEGTQVQTVGVVRD